MATLTFEPCVEPHFHEDSYGYRPKKSAIDAIGITRQRCWEYDFVLEFDIKGLFDNIDHQLLMKAVRKHTDNPWIILYIERWLTTPMQMPDGTLLEKTKGTMQGGVISPILSDLFLHYVFDVWMGKNHPRKPWCRYADDGLVHTRSEQEAQALLVILKERFEMCGLELHPLKTKIIYCKDIKRRNQYSTTQFTFLGYDFRSRRVLNSKTNEVFQGFNPAVSKSATKSMREHIRSSGIRNRSDLSLEEIANQYNPILSGWIGYYGCYNRTALNSVMVHFNKTLTAWAMHKYKKLKRHRTRGTHFIKKVQQENPGLFVHWKQGLGMGFA